jgi:hypothetical protein
MCANYFDIRSFGAVMSTEVNAEGRAVRSGEAPTQLITDECSEFSEDDGTTGARFV